MWTRILLLASALVATDAAFASFDVVVPPASPLRETIGPEWGVSFDGEVTVAGVAHARWLPEGEEQQYLVVSIVPDAPSSAALPYLAGKPVGEVELHDPTALEQLFGDDVARVVRADGTAASRPVVVRLRQYIVSGECNLARYEALLSGVVSGTAVAWLDRPRETDAC